MEGAKYAKAELERRFLLTGVPPGTDEASVRRIHDRYIVGTRLRLRRVDDLAGRSTMYKLGQKDTPDRARLSHMLHTTLYLSISEYHLLAALPADVLVKRRMTLWDGEHSYGIDAFHGPLTGLVLAELGAASEDELTGAPVPRFAVAEVTCDVRFTGGALAAATPTEAASLLDYASRYRRPSAPYTHTRL